MTAPLDPHNEHDFRQLTGAFDRPIAPSPHFADALKKRIQAEAGPTYGKSTTIPQMAPISHRTRHHAYKEERSNRRWLSVAVAAILVVALLGGAMWYSAGRIDTNDGPTRTIIHYAAEPLTSTPEDGVPGSLAGDPGYTNTWAGDIDTSIAYVAAPFGNPQMSATVGIVVDDSLVFTGWPADATPDDSRMKLYRQDLDSGKVLWEIDITIAGRITTDGTSIFALTYPSWPPGPDESPMLSAISLVDGALMWQSPPLAEFAEEPRPQATILPMDPIAIDGQVYVGLDDGMILCFEGANGEIAWTYETGTTVPNDRIPVFTRPVGDLEYVYAVGPDLTIVKLDRHSGTLVDTFELPEQDRHLNNVQLRLQGNHLAVSAFAYDEENPDAMLLVVIDSETGAPIWSTDLDPIAGEIVVTPTMIGIPQAHRNERPYFIQLIPGIPDETWDISTIFLNLQTGDEITRIESESDNGWIPLSGSGETICMADDTITCVDRDGHQTTVKGISIEPDRALFNPVLYHDGRIIIFGHYVPIHIAAPE